MRAVVTGTGSIAARHLRNLRQLFPAARLAVVVRPHGAGVPASMDGLVDESFTDLVAALAQPADLGIVATPASVHAAQAEVFAERGIPTLIEKPLAMSVAECARLIELEAQGKAPLMVGYCLRYHPLIAALREKLADGAVGRIYNVRAEVGQYLPNWRPGTDYRRGVTAQRSLGGGALMELSHELDLVRTLLGSPYAVTAVAARISELETDVEDVAEIVTRHRIAGQEAIASIHLDLFRRIPRRFIGVDGDAGHAELDFVAGRLVVRSLAGEPVTVGLPKGFAINDLYLAEIGDLLAPRPPKIASFADGLATLRLIEAAARSAREGKTVHAPY
ncbi:Gfo/Idh/MocA family protein [Dongia sp.]|uniref:Gfo/Idh/MocA family protein n=1 Tax=Dongia sp. TaxID=1977262 RepID=UPI0035B32ADE